MPCGKVLEVNVIKVGDIPIPGATQCFGLFSGGYNWLRCPNLPLGSVVQRVVEGSYQVMT